MAAIATIATLLNNPAGLNNAQKNTFVQAVWALTPPPWLPGSYFTALIEQLNGNTFIPAQHQAQTYGDLVIVINTIQANRGKSRAGLIPLVAAALGVVPPAIINNLAVEKLIDLATFAWTMFQFQTLPSLPGRPPPLNWDPTMNFNSLLGKYFPVAEIPQTYDIKVGAIPGPNFAGTLIKRPEPYNDRRFTDFFTFSDMDRLSGFKIIPTDNLCDHLRIEKYSGRTFDISVYVFYQATMLETLRDTLLPGANIIIAEETLQTLGLLIPPDPDCWNWFLGRVHKSDGRIDRRAGNQILNGRPVSRRVYDYNYWRPRLLELEKEFEEAAPKGLLRTYLDRRKRRERSNFCVAFWAVVIAAVALLVSAITGIILAKQAYVTNDFARVAADLTSASAANQSASCTASTFGCYPVACCSTTSLGNNIIISAASTGGNSTTATGLTSTSFVIVTSTVFVTSTTTVDRSETSSH